MTFEPTISLDKNDDLPDSSPLVNRYSQVYLKHDGEQILLVIPSQGEINSDLPWSETWQELKHLLKTKEHSWQTATKVCLVARDRLLDARQLQTILVAKRIVITQLVVVLRKSICLQRHVL